MIRLAVLIGRGSRLPNLYEKLKDNPDLEFKVVISHKKEALGINFAEDHGIEAFYFRITDWYKEKSGKNIVDLTPDEKYQLRKSYMAKLADMLTERSVDLVFMTGWDLIMLDEFLSKFFGRVMNVHPSLLPSFPGENAWIQAIDYGVKVAGATVHFVVDEGMDTGPVILQKYVEISGDETAESLREKLNVAEDELGPKAIRLFARGSLKINGRKVEIK